MTWKCPVCTLVNEGEEAACTVCTTPRPALQADTEKLSDKLVAECFASLLTSTRVSGGSHQTKQSSHPASAGRTANGSVHITGATALWISFDPRCETMDTKVRTCAGLMRAATCS